MMRTTLALFVGMLAGAAGTYYLAPARPAISGAGALAAADARSGSSIGVPSSAPAARAPAVAEGLSIYQAAAAADAVELEQRIEQAALGARTRTRQFELEVLLARLAEIDPLDAVRVATDLELETPMLLPLFQRLAEVDERAALRALGSLRDPRAATSVALAVLEVAGNSKRAVERILAAASQVDEAEFRIGAIAAIAARAPDAALSQALAIGNSITRNRALDELAKVWARRAPRDALDRLDVIGDPGARSAFQISVLREWSNQDPLAAFEYASTLGGSRFDARWLVEGLARADAREVLEAASRLPGQAAHIGQQIALQRLALEDPIAALAYVEGLPAGIERQQMMQMVANGYARADPEGALEWARGQRPPIQGLMATVLGGIAQSDPRRALELALAEPSLEGVQAVQLVVMNATSSGAADAQAMAEQLIALPPSNARQSAFQSLTMSWASADPDAALRWLAANRERVGAQGLGEVGAMIGQQHPDAAAPYVDQMPGEVRANWITAIAQGYSRSDPQRAVDWIARFRGEPGYDAGVAAIAQGLAQVDPQGAAQLLTTIGSDTQMAFGASMMIAMQWAQQDPSSAARWASELDEPGMRDAALANVGQQWAAQDAQAAGNWVLSLPTGTTRDAVLGSVLTWIAQTATPDGRLLSAFSSDLTRQQSLFGVVAAVAQRDREQARAFVEQYFTDPAMREQAEQMLERPLGSAFSFGMSPFGAVTPAVQIRAAPARR